MTMPGRTYTAGSGYRYGFNGKENDNEIKGEGAQQDYGLRVYDPRVGRFLSVDPLSKSYPWYTPYQFSGNKPVAFIDMDGREDKWYMVEVFMNPGNTKIEKINVQDVGYTTTNGVKNPNPQGPLGPGVQFTIQLSYWHGNSTVQQQIATGFLPDQKQEKSLWNKVTDFFSDLGKGESQEKAFGYRLTGGDAGGWTVDLGGKATYSEQLDIGMLLQNLGNFRALEGQVGFIDLAEDLVGATKLNQTIKAIDNMTNAAQAAKNHIDGADKLQPAGNEKPKESLLVLPAGSDSCTYCNKVEPKDSLNNHKADPTKNYHGAKASTKVPHKVNTNN
jgi:RHS repeat-associated protein